MANKIKTLTSLTYRGLSTITATPKLGNFRINDTEHYPVMYREIQSFVSDFILHREKDKKSFQMVDCTFGGGNHSVPILRQNSNLKVLGVDLDNKVLDNCREQYSDLIKERRLALAHTNFVNVPNIDMRQAFNRRVGVN